MPTHAHIFDDLYAKYVQPLRSKYDPTIVFPDVRTIRYCNPFKTTLFKIIDDNPHFHIILPEELGYDPLWEFQRQSKFKHKMISFFILNDKTVWIDYGDKVSMGNSFSRHCLSRLRRDQIAGIIKFQYSKNHYDQFPLPVYPFFYPGFNDYKPRSKRYPFVDIKRYRELFKNCCESEKFAANIFARWAAFPIRQDYTNICQSWKGCDIAADTVEFPEYLMRMSTARFAIAIRGNGQFAHREMEAAAIGVPLLYEDRGQRMLEPFLPDIHYIPITTSTFQSKFKYYMQHYDEALAIGKRARDYYDTHLRQAGIQNGFKRIVNMILSGEHWIEY
ncbi:MAG: glycosyltransferase [Promethearchaeota archaeon]|jgi:hypothetical protein